MSNYFTARELGLKIVIPHPGAYDFATSPAEGFSWLREGDPHSLIISSLTRCRKHAAFARESTGIKATREPWRSA